MGQCFSFEAGHSFLARLNDPTSGYLCGP